MIYGSESWVLNDVLITRIQAREMKYLRRDKVRNEIIREEFKIDPVLEVYGKQRLKWFGHMIRMSKQRPAKRVWEARVISNRKRERPKLT